MDRAHQSVRAPTSEGHFVYAGMLDLPFIFDMVLDGSSAGSFSDTYLTRRGYVKILLLLITSLHLFRGIFNTKKRELMLFIKHDIPVGFIQVESQTKPGGNEHRYIMTCAIAPQFRGNRYGREMVELLIARCDAHTEICAVCTKYARAMRRTLMGLRFVRKSIGLGLDAYTFQTAVTDKALTDHTQSADGVLVR